MCLRTGLYHRNIAPRLVHKGCSAGEFATMRERIIPRARGVVVEIGFGSGLNLPHYDPQKVERLIGIEPDDAMMTLAEEALARTPIAAELHPGVGERLPFEDASADTVVITYALCTIAEPRKALREVRRILKPDGVLLFCEHGAATGWRATVQRWLDGAWRHLFGGCSLTREPLALIRAAGFAVEDVAATTFPLQQLPLGMHYSGEARVQTLFAREGSRARPARERKSELISA